MKASIGIIVLAVLFSINLLNSAEAAPKKKKKNQRISAVKKQETTESAELEATAPVVPRAETAPSRMSVGVHLGPNFSTASVSSDQTTPDSSGRTLLSVGAEFQYQIDEMFSVQPELNYVQRGFEYNLGQNILGQNIVAKNRLDYLEIPVFMKTTFATGFGLKPSVFVGPGIGFLVGDTTQVSIGDLTLNVGQDTPAIDYNTVAFSIIAGGGLEYPVLERSSVFLNGRYTLGLSAIAPGDDVVEKNRGIELLTGVKVAL